MLSENYPFHNGTVDACFQTRIYHPLVEPDTGRVLIPDACLYGPRNIETSAPNWHWCLPTGTLHQLCMLLGTTFYDPRFFIPPRSRNPPALHFFRDHQDFHNTAREWTQQFAMERP
ncbi:Oidioi.mRNA.OKI2018_I69.XSR.g15147.t1.cds [Oikopleura dioica]|uniref:Oidioi.mRNA.OKI2018_I69.XSR.g15147.t1.cds n=1 Tax=Oikopleura dioica TaxID=34765 RepID=A0ABN7SFX3_OIKDI|nr:Oidioi.mRNA.OKI2018_I69.XSR.g15147.t1.cds [Oikopleura dioica]